jgi:hypothetical protein
MMRWIIFFSLQHPTFGAKNDRFHRPKADWRPVETPAQATLNDAFAPARVTEDTGRAIEAAHGKPSAQF